MRRDWMICAVAVAVTVALAQPVAATPSLPSSDTPGSASAAPSPGPALPPATPAPCCLIPAATPVEIEVTQLVTSRTARSGDHFPIRLSRAIVIDGRMVMPAGAEGLGEVVDGGPAGLAGRPGKLVLAARWVQSDQTRLPLRSFRLSGSGRDDSKASMAVYMATPYVGLLALGIQGGNIDYPPGTRAIAKVAADTFVSQPAGPPANPSKETTP